ncbi:NADH dehydrogenase alpha subcomplex subunit 8 [Vararia minispora EC-137]|uniref:NADH dehydrogenase alpha subcomplex subunit 8 n=1 Tax=Vararia minispora EC-137 TaxID=1314806 RepID=A0ACB8QY52_9AGAM|nr:NADH dehydrogenase alpha subcomplex subunit 8 [Vararia minispora EC-137]
MSGTYQAPSASTAKPYIEPASIPDELPKVNEIGTTSGPLKSAAFFIGAYCKEYNEDFMLCKAEDRDPAHCLKEGRRVTRCATDLLTKMRENCFAQWDAHWQCLEKNNQEYYLCRKPERTLNQCMFERLGLVKTVPGSPEGQPQIHEKERPIYKAMQK